MEAIAVAVAVPSGEMVSDVIASLDSHPLLDLCGVARSIPDLLRLLERFHPAALLISPSLLEEIGAYRLEAGDTARLCMPVSFLISHQDAEWGAERLAGMLRLPLKYGGLIGWNGTDSHDLFQEIKSKVQIHHTGERSPAAAPTWEGGRGERSRLIALMGCKGGVGTTFLACALAAAMSSTGPRVLLMEMPRELSQLLFLKSRGEGKTVCELLPLAEEISWDLVRLSVHRHAAGFYLLPYGSGGPAAETASPVVLLRNLLFLFDLVIQDFPACRPSAIPALLHHDPEVIMFTLPDTLTATCARAIATSLRETGLDHGRLRLVVNRCGSHHTLGPDELARAAGIELLAALPDDARSGLDFAELGELPAADSPLGRAMADMAAALTGGQVSGATTRRRLRRLRDRTDGLP
ncbi:MAG: cellulose synthase operon protein YhjQ/BcsQ [Actinomycetota bacterium]